MNVLEWISNKFGLGKQEQQALVSPLADSFSPSREYSPDREQVIKRGFASYGKGRDIPMATMSGQLAEVGNELPDPYLAAALVLKETGGLGFTGNPEHDATIQKAREYNNPAGIGPWIRYPNLETSILGGGTGGPNGAPQKGLRGVLTGGAYQDYMNSGNLQDFFKTYTPPGNGNPSMEEQINTINEFLQYFRDAEKAMKEGR